MQKTESTEPEKKSADFQKFLYQESAELVIIATEFFLCHVCRIGGEQAGRLMDPAGAAAGDARGQKGKIIKLRKGFFNMKIIKASNYDEMSKKAAQVIAAQITLKGDSVLGLATGSSPEGTYKYLIDWYNQGDLDFSGITSVNLDEYVGLTADHDQSYAYFMRKHLFDHVNIDLANTNIPCGIAEDPAAECSNYDARIKSLGGVDLQLLGIGPNGHIGFNEPGDELVAGTHVTDLKESTIDANQRFFASRDDVPRQAFTMGIRDILQAKRIVLVASGKNKADAVKKMVFGPITTAVPASLLQVHPDCTVVVDADAWSLCE